MKHADGTFPDSSDGAGEGAAHRAAATYDHASYLKLFDRREGLFADCSAAVREHRLAESMSELEERVQSIHPAGPFAADIAEAATALLVVAAYAGDVDGAELGLEMTLDAAGTVLAQNSALVPDVASAEAWLSSRVATSHPAVQALQARDPGAAALLVLWAAALRGELGSRTRRNDVAVPGAISYSLDAEIGSVFVRRLRSGPGGLFPDPFAMALTHCDDRLRESARAAWHAKALPNATVLWGVAGTRTDVITGNSLGGALALALDELRGKSARLGSIRPRKTRPDYVISAALGPDQTLRGVGELEPKIRAASQAKKTLIVSEEDWQDPNKVSGQEGLPIEHAKTLNGAIAITRRRNPWFIVSVAAALIAVTGISGGIVATQAIAGADHRAFIGSLMTKANQLETLARQTGSGTLPDRQTQAMLMLAAHSLAVQAGNTNVAASIVNNAVETNPGVLTTVDSDLGTIQGIYAAGDGVVVTSQKGEIALINDMTDDSLGTYTNPPGAETLNQPIVTALAPAPNSDLFATVFQVPVTGVAGASTAATLRIFSGGSRLTPIGDAADFTTQEVTGADYSPGGDRLVTVTASEAIYWDTTHATPRIVGQCSLPTGGGVGAMGVVTDPATQQPIALESNSAVISLPSWYVTQASGPCSATQLIAPWAVGLADQALTPYVTMGVNSSGVVMLAALTSRGDVLVRSLSSSNVTSVPLKAAATGITTPGDYLGVQTGASAHASLELWNLTTPKPKFTATYEQHGLPALFNDSGGFAATASGNIVDALLNQEMAYPSGFIQLGPQAASFGTAAGTNALAVDYSDDIAIFTLSNAKQVQWITVPAGYALRSNDDRADSALAISDDDHYLAAIMSPGTPFTPIEAGTVRQLFIWNLQTGTQMALPTQLTSAPAKLGPLDVRFAPAGHDLLVNYTDGALYRLAPHGIGWTATLLRRPTNGAIRFGMDVGPRGIYLIQMPIPPASGRDEVLRLSFRGALLQHWDFTSLDISAPQVAPLSDGGALLVNSGGGDAYRLTPAGRIGQGVDANAEYVSEAAQIPGTQIVLLAKQDGFPETYNLTDNVFEAGDSGSEAYGLLDNFAVTPNGRYLVASDLIDFVTVLGALTPHAQTAYLCDIAGGEMTRQQWAYYVGNIASYRPLCTDVQSSLAGFYNAGRQGQYSAPPLFASTPTAAQFSHYRAACASPATEGFTVAAPFAWKPMAVNEPICSDGTLRWIVTNAHGVTIQAGTVAGQHVLVVSGPLAPQSGESVNTGMDVLLPNAVADSVATVDGVATISPRGIDYTGVQGKTRISSTFGPDSDGYWELLRQVPVGASG